MSKLTLLDIYNNSKKTGVFVLPEDIQGIPNVIWNHNLCSELPSATPSRYKSAVLTKHYMGGMRDGRPWKQSYVFMFYSELPPREGAEPIATITFTIDLTDGSIRFVESALEF